jgi:hypothetical protein
MELSEELLEKIKELTINCSENKSHWFDVYLPQAHKILTDYKNNGGTQRKAYDTLFPLYCEYNNDENQEDKADFVADILDLVVGYFGNKEYLIWEGYMKT